MAAARYGNLLRVDVKDSDYSIEVPERATMEEVLRAIDLWADAPGNESQAGRMWRVLTALRGPDVGDGLGSRVKQKTTAVIRRHALPKLTNLVGADLAAPDSKVDLSTLRSDTAEEWGKTTPHFREHIRDAVTTLDIAKKALEPVEVVKLVVELIQGHRASGLTSGARKAEALEAVLADYQKVHGITT